MTGSWNCRTATERTGDLQPGDLVAVNATSAHRVQADTTRIDRARIRLGALDDLPERQVFRSPRSCARNQRDDDNDDGQQRDGTNRKEQHPIAFRG